MEEKPGESKSPEKEEDDQSLWARFWFEICLCTAAILVVFFGLGGAILGAHLGASEERAQIGDFVGGFTTPVLTSLTFIGVLVGIALQRRELIATRKELEFTRIETEKSAIALKAQAAAIETQNFERTLFESLSFLNSIIEDLSEVRSTQTFGGRKAFRLLHRDLFSDARHIEFKETDDLNSHLEDQKLSNALQACRTPLAPYFRTLYNIYRYLDESSFSDRKFYSRIIRAQLDDYFLVILYYNSLTERGKNFQTYISKFDILDNLREDLLPHKSHLLLLGEMRGASKLLPPSIEEAQTLE
jgi:hypothetical protein